MERIAPVRPYILEGKTYVRRAENRKWYITVNTNGDRFKPLEVFVSTNARDSSILANEAIEMLIELAEYYDISKNFIDDQLEKSRHQSNSSRLCRLLSLLLRHDVPLDAVIEAFDSINHTVNNFTFHIQKVLSEYVKADKMIDKFKCPECSSSEILFESGCKQCMSCGWSKC